MKARIIITTVLMMLAFTSAFAKEKVANHRNIYLVQPGDILQISVWREADMQLEVLVKPDGAFTIPLAGEIVAGGKSVYQLKLEITVKLQQYMPDQSVTVAVKQPLGNKIYVLGKINAPGEVVMTRPIDVGQAFR